MAEQQSPTLDEAVTTFLATLTPEQKQESQLELNRFIRWFGGNAGSASLQRTTCSNMANGLVPP